jgi:hypothetical protein
MPAAGPAPRYPRCQPTSTPRYTAVGRSGPGAQWLDTAVRLRDPSVAQLKNDPLMDPLRPEPHFKAILKQLKFPTG